MPEHYTKFEPKKELEFPEPVATKQYEHPIGAQVPKPGERFLSHITPHLKAAYNAVKPVAVKAVKYAQDRSEAYVKENERAERRAPKRAARGFGGKMDYNMNPFGAGDGGFNEPPEHKPRSKPRRKLSAAGNAPSMFGIPKHMKHLF